MKREQIDSYRNERKKWTQKRIGETSINIAIDYNVEYSKFKNPIHKNTEWQQVNVRLMKRIKSFFVPTLTDLTCMF